MYETVPPNGIDSEAALSLYASFLRDLQRFGAAMERVLNEWPISCEQFLSNPSINHIAWLGQSSMCIETGVPACFRAGFKLMTAAEQDAANALAEKYYKLWQSKQSERELQITSKLGKREVTQMAFLM